ncbi:MAG: redoxin domain-containing protein [Pirellulales bacterium]|nr:redoxin domain-containing protein [Pirellulales bacterium]
MSMRRLCVSAVCASLVLGGAGWIVTGSATSAVAAAPANEGDGRIGLEINDFTLRDHLGATHSLKSLAGKQGTVVVFLGADCPLVKQYAPRLTELADEFKNQGVNFVGINSNRQDSATEIAASVRTTGLNFPVLKDVGNVVADQLRAVRTPEVFLLDADGVVRYWGRIDDQYGFMQGVAYQKAAPGRRDLAEAIREVLADKDVSVAVTSAPGCLIGRVRETDTSGEVTYTNQIARIFQNHCVECHRPGEIAPFAMTTYDEVLGWGDMIKEVVREQRMPPWHADKQYGHFSNDVSLTDEEKGQIYAWVDAGCPEGEQSDLPAPREFATGWQMPQPDLVLAMGEKPFHVPATGYVDYKYFTVDPGFTEDMWVQAAEARPGNREVVHHIIVFVKSPNDRSQGFGALSGFLVATAPGAKPMIAPDGMAKFIPKGSKLVFQMHYTPNGRATDDLSSVGLKFVKASEVQHRLETKSAANPFFAIPAFESDYAVDAYKKFRHDSLLVSLYPHMHLRGKAFRYTAIYPDGKEEVLLDVPRYDFNWQNTYVFDEPKFMPKGTRLYAKAVFDNSEENLANPDPSREVTFGEQTYDEMMIGFFDAVELNKSSDLPGNKQRDEKVARQPNENDSASND